MKRIFLALITLSVFGSCQLESPSTSSNTQEGTAQQVALANTNPVKLSDYWYKGKAELSRYELRQNQYRDVHPGEAVMVFVTEDFLTDKQVKNDNYTNPNSIGILKNNMVRKFPTGIYDYSMMASIFTPVDVAQYPQTLKVTTTSQEWCGHTFMQLNFRNEAYQMELRSYFEGEGDANQEVPYAILEDEIYNRIRLNPNSLPTGTIKVLPSTMVTRLMHLPFRPVEAQASLKNYSGDTFTGSDLQVYTLEYPSLRRKLEIVFQNEAPYIIEGWVDAYPSAFDRQVRATIAKRTNTIVEPYWKQNSLNDMALREKLGLKGI